mmetsp:Transcript_113940/g.362327  ORF Transcript_113940/g.362327 Transcript_113940/m.362327 type:complete len:226 (+) Transcript_113940:2694-3371(+)
MQALRGCLSARGYQASSLALTRVRVRSLLQGRGQVLLGREGLGRQDRGPRAAAAAAAAEESVGRGDGAGEARHRAGAPPRSLESRGAALHGRRTGAAILQEEGQLLGIRQRAAVPLGGRGGGGAVRRQGLQREPLADLGREPPPQRAFRGRGPPSAAAGGGGGVGQGAAAEARGGAREGHVEVRGRHREAPGHGQWAPPQQLHGTATGAAPHVGLDKAPPLRGNT